MKEMLEFVGKDEMCIPHTFLVKYGVLSDKNVSTNVKQLLERYEFIKDKDFTLFEVKERGSDNRPRIKINYIFHPRAFKKCLMRAKNTKQYADFYLLLEECIRYYHEYQLLYTEHLLNQSKDKIDDLLKQTNELTQQNREIILDLHKKDKQNDELIQQNKEMMAKIDKQSEELTEVKITLNKINHKLDRSAAHIPSNVNFEDRFALLKKDNEFYVIRRQKKSLTMAIRQKEKDGYELIPIIDYQTIPNSITFWNAIRDVLLKDNQIVCKRNTFMLTEKLSEDDFNNIIKEVFNQRLDIDN
jgi:hypothetical protein